MFHTWSQAYLPHLGARIGAGTLPPWQSLLGTATRQRFCSSSHSVYTNWKSAWRKQRMVMKWVLHLRRTTNISEHLHYVKAIYCYNKHTVSELLNSAEVLVWVICNTFLQLSFQIFQQFKQFKWCSVLPEKKSVSDGKSIKMYEKFTEVVNRSKSIPHHSRYYENMIFIIKCSSTIQQNLQFPSS